MLAFSIIACKNNGCQQSGIIAASPGSHDRLYIFGQPERLRMEQDTIAIKPPVIGEMAGAHASPMA